MDTTTEQVAKVRIFAVAGLITCGVGLVILKIAGVEVPIVPPGLVVVLVATVLVVTVQRRWVAFVAIAAALAEAVSLIGSGSARSLSDSDDPTAFAGTCIRLVGIVVTLVAGVHLARQRMSLPAD